MTCEEAKRLMMTELDHGNTPGQSAALQAHLDGCQACAALLEAYRNTDLLLKDLWEEPPADLCDEIMREIKRQPQPKKKPAKRYRPFLAAAAAAIVLLGGALWELPRWTEGSEAEYSFRMRAEPAAMALQEEPAAQSLDGQSPQMLAQSLGADVVVAWEVLPELEACVYENLSDGSVLYWLTSSEEAYDLSVAYDLMLYSPEEHSNTGVSYALVCQQTSARDKE